jgi:hypothetical protein
LLGAQPFNYTDAVDALPNAIHAFSTQPGLVQQNAAGTNVGFISEDGLFQQAGPVGFSISNCVAVYQLAKSAATATGGQTAAQVADSLSKGLQIILGGAVTLIAQDVTNINAALSGTSITAAPADVTAADLCAAAGASPLSAFTNNGTGWNSENGVQAPLGGQAGRSYGSPNFGVDNNEGQMVGVSDAGTFVLSETALTMHCWGQNPVVTAKLQLNGQDRFSEREGTYFDLVQPFQHHTRNPDTGINLYSFALRPEEHQPSGTCNFSRIDNATLQLVLSNATVEGTKTAKVRVYATNYNVLRVMSGMGGLAYSN